MSVKKEARLSAIIDHMKADITGIHVNYEICEMFYMRVCTRVYAHSLHKMFPREIGDRIIGAFLKAVVVLMAGTPGVDTPMFHSGMYMDT